MTTFDDHGRPKPPTSGDGLETLLGFIEFHRATLRWKTDRLDAKGPAQTVGASTMTLGGLLKHLAFVEWYWFSWRLHHHPAPPPWDTVDWDADPDWDWHSAAEDPPETLRALWEEAVDRARTEVRGALDRGGLEQLAAVASPNGKSPSLRWILVHMIEEYARHNGHADLIRESVDGETGQ